MGSYIRGGAPTPSLARVLCTCITKYTLLHLSPFSHWDNFSLSLSIFFVKNFSNFLHYSKNNRMHQPSSRDLHTVVVCPVPTKIWVLWIRGRQTRPCLISLVGTYVHISQRLLHPNIFLEMNMLSDHNANSSAAIRQNTMHACTCMAYLHQMLCMVANALINLQSIDYCFIAWLDDKKKFFFPLTISSFLYGNWNFHSPTSNL